MGGLILEWRGVDSGLGGGGYFKIQKAAGVGGFGSVAGVVWFKWGRGGGELIQMGEVGEWS